MQVGTIGTSEKKQYRIEKPVAGLLLYLEVDKHYVAGLPNEMRNLTNPLTLTVFRETSKGNKSRVLTGIPIMPLIEASTHGEGYVELIEKTNGVNPSTTILRCFVPLGKDGAISLSTNEKLVIELNSGANCIECEIYAFEHPMRATELIKTERVVIEANTTEKVLDVSEIDLLLIPSSAITASFEVNMKYSNGNSVRLTDVELNYLNSANNDVLYAAKSLGEIAGGSGQYHILDVSMVTDIEIFRQTTGAIDMFTQESMIVDNYASAVEANERLVNVSHVRKLPEVMNSIAQDSSPIAPQLARLYATKRN